MPKTKIKDLLNELGEICLNIETGFFLYENEVFQQIVKRIKSLRKENKRLKKEKELIADQANVLSYKAIRSLQASADKMIREMPTPKGLERIVLPVAEFKCAKTNKPGKNGVYGIIYKLGNCLYYSHSKFDGQMWSYNYEVVAFTETNPQNIVDALNKEK